MRSNVSDKAAVLLGEAHGAQVAHMCLTFAVCGRDEMVEAHLRELGVEEAAEAAVAVFGGGVIQIDAERAAAQILAEEQPGGGHVAVGQNGQIGVFMIRVVAAEAFLNVTAVEEQKILQKIVADVDGVRGEEILLALHPHEAVNVGADDAEIQNARRDRADHEAVKREQRRADGTGDAQLHDRGHDEGQKDDDGRGIANIRVG